MFLIILVGFFTLVAKSTCDTKVWTFSTDISDPKNWKKGRVQADCNGLVFSQHHDVPVFIKNLKVKQLVLPLYGTIRFEEGSTVLFDEESRDDLNCVELQVLSGNFWYRNKLWKNLDNPDNPAIPLYERLPCKYDDVVLPKGFNSSIMFTNEGLSVKSVTFGDKKLTQSELNTIMNSKVGKEVFPSWIRRRQALFKIKGQECKDPTGCDRTTSFNLFGSTYVLNNNEPQCSNTIGTLGMERICGAQILIKTLKPGFKIAKIKEKLKDYKSYTHASKYDPMDQIQIIFTEKNFTGSSLTEAKELYNILQEEGSYFCEDITLQMSGPPLFANKVRVQSALSLVFGTLLGVVVMFGLLFLVYSPTVGNLNLRNRLLSTRPLSTYILHYDNIEDRANIIDAQSMAGSVMALNRSFDNPMYEHASSTRSTSNETVIAPNSEENEQILNEGATVLDSAKELEDIDLHNEKSSGLDDVLLKDL